MSKRSKVVSLLVASAMLIAPVLSAPASAGLTRSDAVVVDQTDLVYRYELAYNPERNEYAGVYQTGTGPADFRVMMVRLDATGQVVSGPTVVGDALASPRRMVRAFVPRITYNPAQNQYLVAMMREFGGNADPADDRSLVVFGRLVSDLGVPVGGEVRLANTPANVSACQSLDPDVIADPNTGGYLLGFNLFHGTNTGTCGALSPGNRSNVLVPLSASLTQGTAVSVPTSSTLKNPTEVRLAHNPVTNQFMVTQRDTAAVGTARIYSPGLTQLQVIDIDDFPANTAGGTGGISGSVPAADPNTGEWLVASSTTFQSRVVTNSISPTGSLLRTAVTSTVSGIPTELVPLGDGRWVVGTTAGQVAELSSDGAALSDRAVFTGNLRYVAVASNDTPADPLVVTFGPVANKAAIVTMTPFAEALLSIVPARLLETRTGSGATTTDGQFQGVGRLTAGQTLELTVTGRAGVPTDADAVMINLTAITPDGPGFLTVYPCGSTRPDASNVNYNAGDVAPNAVLAKIGTNGTICIYTLAATDVIADVNGYVPGGGALSTVVPARLLETRTGSGATTTDGQFQGVGRLTAGQTLELTVTGRAGVPTDADAVMINLTAITPDGPGFLTVYPCGSTRPDASNVNYNAGDVAPNAVLAKIGTNGTICIYTLAATDVIADVNGYVPGGGALSTVVPARLLETRTGSGATTTDGQFQGVGRLTAGQTLELTVTGRAGVPTDADAVMINLTAITPDGPGFLTVYPCGSTRPDASNVNYNAGDVAPNAVLAKIGTNGTICIYTLAATDVIADVNGYTPSP